MKKRGKGAVAGSTKSLLNVFIYRRLGHKRLFQSMRSAGRCMSIRLGALHRLVKRTLILQARARAMLQGTIPYYLSEDSHILLGLEGRYISARYCLLRTKLDRGGWRELLPSSGG